MKTKLNKYSDYEIDNAFVFSEETRSIIITRNTASEHRHLFHSKNIYPLLFLTSR